MRALRDTAIKRKLTIISMLAIGVALLVACATFLTFEYRLFRATLVDDLVATAQVLGDNSSAALAFDVPASAELTLQSLKAKPHVIGAALYDKDGRVFVTYRGSELPGGLAFVPPPMAADDVGFGGGSLNVFDTITVGGERMGTIFIRSSLKEMRERMLLYALVTLVVMLVASSAAFLLVTKLHRVIVEPIAHLAHVAATVASNRDYSIRAKKRGADELGQLIDGFNEMLRQIQTSDGALQQARGDLEMRNLDLEQAMRAKNMFLANMSHELRTPLNAIIGFTSTLLMKLPGVLNSVQEEQLTVVKTSARHLLSLINDLLDLSKIESGKIDLVPESFSCQQVAQDTIASLRPMAELKKLDLLLRLPQKEVRVTADRRALHQILLNLCNNAIKFTDSGSVTIELKELPQQRQLEFSVTDTGIGIQPGYKARLFQAFSQMESTDREGTGLGLHLSRRLAQLMGGTIDFDSQLGRGSRFWLTLPQE